jgi:hypothetical protein
MVYLRESETRLLDHFRSLTETGQRQIYSYAARQVFENPVINAENSLYENISAAENITPMNKREQAFIGYFRRCNDTGCVNIENTMQATCKKFRNPDYITTEEWTLLDYFRSASALDRFRIIQTVMNSADRNERSIADE